MNDRRQAQALAKNFKRLPFQECGQCGSKGSIYKPHYPALMKCERWCYVCGAKDGQTQRGGSEMHAALMASVREMSEEQAREELVRLIHERRAK